MITFHMRSTTVYAVLPSSLFFLLAYSYATQRFDRGTLFNAVVSVFLVFFAAFALAYPSHEALHSHALGSSLAQVRFRHETCVPLTHLNTQSQPVL